MDKPPFKVIETLEQIDRKEQVRRFLAHPATQTAIGAGLKSGVGLERHRLSRREKTRAEQPALFPEIVAAEAESDKATASQLDEMAERAEQMINAGRRRSAFAVVK